MDAIVTASFLLVGWNTYSAIVVAKDTYTGEMPGPKSLGYSIAGLAGLSAFLLYFYGVKAEENPQLLAAEGSGEISWNGGRMVSIEEDTTVNYYWRTRPEDIDVDDWDIESQVEEKVREEMYEGDSGSSYWHFNDEDGNDVEVDYNWNKFVEDGEEEYIKSWAETDESFGAESPTTCEDCGVKIGYDEAFDWEGLDRCEDCYDYWMMKDRQNYTADETDCISCGFSISPNDSRFELVDGLCPDCKDTDTNSSFGAEDRDEDERMTRAEAEDLVQKVEKLMTPYVERLEVCGSYRRGSQSPGDLDVIIIPKKGMTLPMIVQDINPAQVNWLGEQKTQIVIDGHKVDFRVSSIKGWGAALLYFTGPAGYNIGMRMRAKKLGMKLNEYGIFDRATDKYLGGETEDEIYQVLGKTPKTPEMRNKRAEQTFVQTKANTRKCSHCGVIGETFTVKEKHFCGPVCLHKYEGLAAESWLTEGECAMCNNDAKFVVEDLAVGPRGFCCEACYAIFDGLPVKEEGYYGLASENAESSKSEGDLINEIIEDVFKEFKIKSWSPRSYDELNNWYAAILESQPKDGKDDVYIAHGGLRYKCSFGGKGKCFEIPKAAISNRFYSGRQGWVGSHFSSIKYVEDNDYGLWRYFPTEDTKDTVKSYQEKLRKKYDLPIELFVKETYHDDEYGYEPSLIMGVSLGKSEKNAEEVFEAPRATYTDAGQQTFEKSYNVKAKKPLNAIVKDKMGGRLPSDDSRKYNWGRDFTISNMSKKESRLVEQYFSGLCMAFARFETSNQGHSLTSVQSTTANNAYMKSLAEQEWLKAELKDYVAMQNMSDQEIVDYIAGQNGMDFNNMLQLIRYGELMEGPYADIKMVATDRSPFEVNGGYGNVYYSQRNPYSYESLSMKNFGSWDKTDNTFKSKDGRRAGKVFTRITKLRPYTTFPDITADEDSFIQYSTDGGYGRSTHFTMSPSVFADLHGRRNVDSYSANIGIGWRYNIKDWEGVRSSPYRYATMVRLPTMEELFRAYANSQPISLNSLRTIYNKSKNLNRLAEAAKQKKENEEQALRKKKSDLAAKNQAQTDLEEINKSIAVLIKKKVIAARAAGLGDDEIYETLENTLYDIEDMVHDWEPDNYMAEDNQSFGCGKCGIGPLHTTKVEGLSFVLCPDCGLVKGKEDITGWNVTWSKDTPYALANRPFADVEWDDSEE